MAGERLTEGSAQAIGLAVQQGLHKGPAPGLIQVHLDVPQVALEFVDDGGQGMPVTRP